MVRYDGEVLQPANKNPWYVLATLAGEDAGEDYGRWQSLSEKNRRYWNSWLCHGMGQSEREKLAQTLDLDYNNFSALQHPERAEIKKLFAARLGDDAVLPKPTDMIDLRKTYFEKTVDFGGFVFFTVGNFNNAHFGGGAHFYNTHFQHGAYFRDVYFQHGAYFYQNIFYGGSIFTNAYFAETALFLNVHFKRNVRFKGDAIFSKAHFDGFASFNDTRFGGRAIFGATHFNRRADFSSATFLSKTRFRHAKFKNYVPEFHAAQIYDDTLFPTSDKMEDHWPSVPKSKDAPTTDLMSAEDQKRAYNRLRLFMNRSLQVDEEMFFHRQEMACKAEIETGFVRWLFKIFGWASGYGSYVVMPVLILIANIVLGGILFAIEYGRCGWCSVLDALLYGFGISFTNVFSFFGFGRFYYSTFFVEMGWPWAIFAASQTVFGFITMFLLGLALRNRFRLR